MSDLWSWNNAVDAAGTLITSSVGSAGILDTTNLIDPRVGRVWRAGATSATLGFQFANTTQVKLFGLFGHNWQDIGPVTLKLGTSADSGDLWTKTFDPAGYGRKAVFVLDVPVDASFATASVAGGDPLEIGRVWIGAADWASRVTHSVDGSSWGAMDLSLKSRTRRSGAVLGDRGALLRTFTAAYSMLDEDEYAGALFDMDERGTVAQMLFVPDPEVYEPSKHAILGTLDEIPNTNWQAHLTAGRTITITEAG